VYALGEKSLSKRLNELFQKHLYSLALRVVADIDEGEVAPHPASIHKRHADHLYDKGDFEGSVAEYVQTIGQLDSSVVIRKFLDAQQIPNLTSYLEAYHHYVQTKAQANIDKEEKDDASSPSPPSPSSPCVSQAASPAIKLMAEHTTLLIHCYTKQHRDEALHRFLGLDRASDVIEPGFHVEAAIRALREAGYADEALELSRRNGDHPTYLHILLEDAESQSDTTEKALEALSYIRKLPFFEAEMTLIAHAHKLVTRAVHETTTLLMEICSPSDKFGGNGLFSDPEAFLPAYVEYSERQRRFVHHEELRRFLWHVAQNGSGTVKVFNTLLELCLHGTVVGVGGGASKGNNRIFSGGGDSGPKKGKLTEAGADVMKVLKDPTAKYDPDHALVLVQRHNFSPGQLYLYEKRKMYHMIVQHHMDIGDDRAILAAGRKYGERDPNVWSQILSYYASKGGNTLQCEPYICQALRHIAVHQTLSPINVVNILSKNKSITLAVTREYLMEHFRAVAQATQEAEEEVAATNRDTAVLKARVDALTNAGRKFQNTRDHLFESQALDIPSIHFLSGHSYNLDNLTRREDGELECPISGADHKRILQSAGQLRQRGTDSEGFFRDLSHASSQSRGIDCIAEQFGRGLFTENAAVKQQLRGQSQSESQQRQRESEERRRQQQQEESVGNPFL
jgi:hypothetical protein